MFPLVYYAVTESNDSVSTVYEGMVGMKILGHMGALQRSSLPEAAAYAVACQPFTGRRFWSKGNGIRELFLEDGCSIAVYSLIVCFII